MRRLVRRRLIWTALLVVAVGVLVLLLGLIGVGYLRLPTAPAATVTISEIQWTIQEGTTASGVGWFGPSHVNDTANSGLPLSFAAGTTFRLAWGANNRDNVSHTVYSVTATSPPFSWVSSTPALPSTVPIGDDSFGFSFYFSTPSSASGTFVLTITVNALATG